MCGIAGFVNGSQKIHPLQQEDVLNRMLNRIIHRGPDEMGLYLNNSCCLGSVRLSIIDLASGQQPLCNQDGSLWIAYNGEVFNYIELREELLKKGHRFKTHCDTEVVLHMFEEYGQDCLSRLNGQFAFSIWDEKRQSLFMARDRSGIRPLYYTKNQEGLVFASEIKSLFEYPAVKRVINTKALQQTFTFWTTLTPLSIFDEVYELPPGHYLKYERGQVQVQSYWSLSFDQQNNFKGSIEEAGEEFSYLFEDAIKLRLRADVQVAAYLSGGLDSSVTTSFINSVQPDVLNTYSIGFEDVDFDESYYQQEVSRFFETRHSSVACHNDDISQMLEKAIWHTEFPLLRTSPIPMMKLSKLVRDSGIKVVITGEGADENLGGYNIFKEAIVRQFWSKYPDSKLRPLLLKKLYPYIPQLKNATPSMLRMFFGYQLANTNSPVYSHLLRWRNGNNLLGHFSAQTKRDLDGYNPVAEYAEAINDKVKGYSTLAKAQYIESTIFMSGYLLSSQGDRVGMANSIEGRYPFLDYRLIEFCASLPDSYKLKGLNEKYLMKRLMKGRLPDIVINRPKQAYRAPIAKALLEAKNGIVDRYLNDSSLNESGLFDCNTVKRLINKLRNAQTISEVDNMSLIGLLSTQILYQQFIKDYKPMSDHRMTKGIVRNLNLIDNKNA